MKINNKININNLKISDNSLMITLDDYRFWTVTKYTILEMGYATYLSESSEQNGIDEWIATNGEVISAEEGNIEIKSNKSFLVTSNPILFAISYKYWWYQNGIKAPIMIPKVEEAIEIQRNRRIINDFNLKYKNKLPHEIFLVRQSS